MKPERINELLKIQGEIVYQLAKDAEKGYTYLQREWAILDRDDKKLIQPKIIEDCYMIMNDPREINHKKDIFFRAAINYLSDDSEGKISNNKLTLGPKVKAVQIAKLFYDLKVNGVIENTNEEIALVLKNVFSINYNTGKNYLNTPTKFQGVKDLFRMADD